MNDPNVRVRGNYAYLGFGHGPGQATYTTFGMNVVVGGTYTYSGFDYVPGPTTRIAIDPNVRVRGNDTYAGFEDVVGPIAVGEVVEVYEPESGLAGEGRVTEIDGDRQLVYLSVDWSSLTDEVVQHEQSAHVGGLLYIPTGPTTQPGSQDPWMQLMSTPCLAYVGLSDATLWVTAPARTWRVDSASPWSVSPHLEITQAYAIVSTDRVVAA